MELQAAASHKTRALGAIFRPSARAVHTLNGCVIPHDCTHTDSQVETGVYFQPHKEERVLSSNCCHLARMRTGKGVGRNDFPEEFPTLKAVIFPLPLTAMEIKKKLCLLYPIKAVLCCSA